MKKVFILFLALLVACAVPLEPSGEEIAEITPEPVPIEIETEEQAEPVVVAPVAVIEPDVKELIGKIDKIHSYTYSDNKITLDTFRVKGDLVRIDLDGQVNYNDLYSYDTILWDKKADTTYGFCTDSGFCDPRAREVYFDVEYEGKDTIIDAYALDDDWVSAYFTGATQTIAKTQLLEVAFRISSTRNGTALLDNFYGLPHVVEYLENGKPDSTIELTSLKINNVKDADMVIGEFFEKID
jgi:hypothetical protein|tara:strand:+ start:4869 stop:5588 length:720 start_codon:yes stop_codon:yes gene_type:complete